MTRWWLYGGGVWADSPERNYQVKPPFIPAVIVTNIGAFLAKIEEGRYPNPKVVAALKKLNKVEGQRWDA